MSTFHRSPVVVYISEFALLPQDKFKFTIPQFCKIVVIATTGEIINGHTFEMVT